MHKLEHKIKSVLRNIDHRPIYVGVSGGVDSMVLLFALNKLGFDVTALHMNYNLRGDDSISDEELVRNFCKTNQIELHVKSIQLENELQESGNLQSLARDYRYSFFSDYLEDEPESLIAVAHHLNDQVETFFMNLSRKSGVMGLAAMLKKNGRVIRPLIDLSKNEIYDYARSNDIQWREDTSNAKNVYKRNRWRNELIPALKKEIPEIEESVLVLIKQFQEKQKALENIVRPLFDEIKRTKQLSIKSYNSLDEFEKVELFRQFSQPASSINELEKLVHAQKGKMLALQHSSKNPFQAIVKGIEKFEFADIVSRNPELIIEEVNKLPEVFSKDTLYLDTDAVKGELTLRKWKIGDRISPIGMKGSQLISDVISDAKLSANEKTKVYVLHDDQNILWCVGLKIGRLAIASKSSRSILKCSVKV